MLWLKPVFGEGLTPQGQGLEKKTQLLEEDKTSLTAPFHLFHAGFASSLTNTNHLREGQSNSWVCFGQEMLKIGLSRIGTDHIKAREMGPGRVCPRQLPSEIPIPYVAPGAKDDGFG